MSVIRVSSFLKFFILAKITIGYWIFGIDFVVRQLAISPGQTLPYLLKKHGASIGKKVNFKGGLLLDNVVGDEAAKGDFSNLVIGDKSYIGKNVFFDLPGRIVLEAECVVSAGAKFMTHEDCGDRLMSKYYPRKKEDILIGEGSWIGVNAVILSGVTLGKCCVVGAGAVVTQSFPDYSLIVGVPARFVRSIKEDSEV